MEFSGNLLSGATVPDIGVGQDQGLVLLRDHHQGVQGNHGSVRWTIQPGTVIQTTAKLIFLVIILFRYFREIEIKFYAKFQARRKIEAVQLVGHIKDCFVKHWKHLEDKQKEQVE